jgi:hypothetical protein
MTATNTSTLRLIELTRNELDRLEHAVRRGESMQWERPPSQKTAPSEIAARGGHQDPTGDTAVDSTRLHLREVMRLTNQEAARILTHTRNISGRLQHSVSRWEGP